jgi:thymidylate synthase
MNTLDKQYQDLLQYILEYGVSKEDRTGTGTLSTFGRQIRHNLNDGFPLLTTKKMAIKSIMTELKWFLKGDTNIKYLLENGCHIWTGDAKKRYDESFKKYWGEKEGRESKFQPISTKEFEKRILEDDEFANKWGELGPIYGKQWREWETSEQVVDRNETVYIDQIANLIRNLKTNPDSRRLMVSAWNVSELDQVVLPPCHYGFQLYTRLLNLDERINVYNSNNPILGKSSDYYHEHLDDLGVPRRVISLSWNQRSVDTFLGLPFNIASYGMLLSLIAEEVGMLPGALIGNLGDTHLYLNHLEQAKEQLSRDPFEHLPKLKLNNVELLDGEFDYEILHYHSHPTIKAPLSN